MYTDEITNDNLSIDETSNGQHEVSSAVKQTTWWMGLLGALGIVILRGGLSCSDPSLQLYCRYLSVLSTCIANAFESEQHQPVPP